MINYKDTLNLPETDFPMRGNLAKREPVILSDWDNRGLYHQIRQAKKGMATFILADGPPYANGKLHIGHAVNKILKDIIIKSKTLMNYDCPYVPGWDCHGLPIELKVEEQVGKAGETVSAAEFRQMCRHYAGEQIEDQKKDFIRMGVLGYWESPYRTMDYSTEANIIRTLAKVIKNGHLQKGFKPVHWCCDCMSSLAEAEVEYHDRVSTAIDVKFEAVNSHAVAVKFKVNTPLPIYAMIWTTTPWTLPASRAIAVNPMIDYQLVETDQQACFILAADLVASVMSRGKVKNWRVLGTARGLDLEFLRFAHPLLDIDEPIILGDHVTLNTGTGLVHTAPGHGPDDFLLGIKYKLDIVNPVDTEGRYIAGTGMGLDGVSVFQANDIIPTILQRHGALFHVDKIKHSYPCCWRHKTPIIFRATPQWFISMDKQGLREDALTAIKQVEWIPQWGQTQIESMVAGRPDWCISRQRLWGVPMALFVNKKTDALHPKTLELMAEVANRVEKSGIQAWWDLDAASLLGVEADDYRKVTDILDVWFDSGSTFYSVVKTRPEFRGAEPDLYLEGSDQHRGWFMSSLMLSIVINRKAPYKQVVTHGFVVDGQGRKMSKSLGNIITPQQVMNKFGADILRLWIASTDYSGEIAFSDEIIKRSADAYRRIRNTARFLLANLNDFDPDRDIVNNNKLIALDGWAINVTKSAQAEIISAYKRYDFHQVIKRLMQFCSVEMGSFYLDLVKDRQYTAKRACLARRSCQTALYHIAESLVCWIAPILSFTADEIWRHLPGKRSDFVFTEQFYTGLFSFENIDGMDDDFWQLIIQVRSEVNKVIEQARHNKVIGGALEASVTLYVKSELAKQLSKLSTELRFVLLTSAAQLLPYEEGIMAIETERSDLKIALSKAEGEKCPRCWHYTIDYDATTQLCSRCRENIEGEGEIRRFV